MRFRRRFGRSRSRRAVAWIPGYSSMDPINGTFWKTLVFAALPGSVNTWAAAVQLTVDADLSMHGGEAAVLQRIRGMFAFAQCERNAGAGFAANSALCRVCIVTVDVPIPGTIAGFEYVDSAGLGYDNLLWTRDMVLPSTAMGVTGTGLDATEYGDGARWAFCDVKAKRRLKNDRQVFLTLQTVLPAGTTAFQVRFLGHLRILLKRPR